MSRVIENGFVVVDPKGRIIAKTLRRKRTAAIYAALKEGEAGLDRATAPERLSSRMNCHCAK